MAEAILGLDFGTTNSLAAYVDASGTARSLTNIEDDRPHPSTVWYRGGEIIVGREARSHLEAGTEAISGAFALSPKTLLRKQATVDIEGTTTDPRDIVKEVLEFLKRDAASLQRGASARKLTRAVMTIPVELDGEGRKRLREAARKAGIAVEQFVHEPLAALYGWLRSKPDYAERLSQLEGKRVLVFDWGGGTLDLTLCLIRGQQMVQLGSAGDNEVGGDYFDLALRNKVRQLHAAENGIENIEQYETPESRARLLTQCELAKIQLSEIDAFSIFVPYYLNRDSGQHLNVRLTQQHIEDWTGALIDRGLAHIDKLLEAHQLTPQEVEICLPTGGMVNLPAVRNGLVQRFGGNVPQLKNGDRIIAEGAAWVAHDGLRLSLAKPVELVQPDGSYLEIVQEGQQLPIENQSVPILASQFYCVDPRDGVATFQFVRPLKVGYGSRTSPRETYATLSLNVDQNAPPFLERLSLTLTIDHDYVVHLEGKSSGRQDVAYRQIHNLEFALSLPASRQRKGEIVTGDDGVDEPASGTLNQVGAIQLRSNVIGRRDAWWAVPGDIVDEWRPSWFDNRSANATNRQKEEKAYYSNCSQCRRSMSRINAEGCLECRIVARPPIAGEETISLRPRA
jgi:molecular chaperone DnaK